MNKKTCFVIYSLNIFSLPLLWLLRPFYTQIYYFWCSKFLKRRFGFLIMQSKAIQVCEYDYFDGGLAMHAQQNAIDVGAKLGIKNQRLRDVFVAYGGHPRYAHIVDQAFVRGWTKHAFLGPFLSKFLNSVASRYDKINVWIEHPIYVFGWEELPKSVNLVTLFRPVLAPIFFLQRLLMLLILACFPIFHFARLLKKGFKIGPINQGVSKSILFVHRSPQAFPGKSRYEYFFHRGILKYRDCAHYSMETSYSFSSAKTKKISDNDGTIVFNKTLRFPKSEIWSSPFHYYKCFFIKCWPISFSNDLNYSTFIQVLEILHLSPIASILLNTVKPKLIHFETETAPFANLCAIEARKMGIKSSTMLHGDAGQDKPSLSRANMQFEYFITPGNRDKILRTNNPGIDHFVAVGNHEIEETLIKGDKTQVEVLPKFVRQNRSSFRVVGCFAVTNAFSFNRPALYSENSYVDEIHAQDLFKSYLSPLFEWVQNREDVCLVWKAKYDRSMYEDNPWVMDLIKNMPPNRFVLHHDVSLADIIEESDVCVSSGASSTIGCAIAYKKPVITIDYFSDAWAAIYHPLMGARSGKELVKKLEILEKDGLPSKVYDAFLADWYANGVVDLGVAKRVSKLFNEILRAQRFLANQD